MAVDEQENLAEAIRRLFAPFGGVELELPKRDFPRDLPDFGNIGDVVKNFEPNADE